MLRKTVDRDVIVEVANRMLSHLAESATKSDLDKRNAIREVVNSILLEGNSYAGFRYLNPPNHVLSREKENYVEGFVPPHIHVNGAGEWVTAVYDESRVNFY